MIKTKLWPVKVDSDGTLKHDLMHRAVLIPFLLALGALCVVLYFTYPGLIFRDWYRLSKIIDFGFVCMLVLGIPNVFMLSSSVQTLGPLILDTKATLTPRFYINIFTLNVLYAASIICIEVMVFPQPYCSSTMDHLMYWISLVYMNLYLILNQIGGSILGISSLFSFMDELSTSILKTKLSTDDLKRIKGLALKLNLHLNSSMPGVFLFVQICFIFGGYMIVVQEVFPFHALFQFLYSLFAAVCSLNLIDECYSLSHDLACKAR